MLPRKSADPPRGGFLIRRAVSADFSFRIRLIRRIAYAKMRLRDGGFFTRYSRGKERSMAEFLIEGSAGYPITLRTDEESFSFFAEGVELLRLKPVSAADRELPDEGEEVCAYREETLADGLRAVWTAHGGAWEKKEYELRADRRAARFTVRLFGSGAPREIRWFSEGTQTYELGSYYTPVSPFEGVETRRYSVTQAFRLGLGYMCPPPLCYVFAAEGLGTRFAAALCARPGEYCFDSFDFRPAGRGGPGFSADYRGYTLAEGSFETATLVFFAAGSEEEALGEYTALSRAYGYSAAPARPQEDWWQGPLFCGWGEQGWLAAADGSGDAKTRATQADYEEMSRELDARGIPVTAIIIDDKWQTCYGSARPDENKWPDLRAFADAEHARGRRVLLWFKVWNGEGLSEEEQVLCLCRPVGADPTSPAYRRRVREMMRFLLSHEAGCCDCDGFKLDFANCMPLGADLSTHERGVYGIELEKRMFTLLYTEAKAVKPDALINSSCCCPYFAEVTDQVRLHDYFGAARSGAETVRARASIYRAVMPEASVDTDGGGGSARDVLRYMHAAARVGVPDLYYLHRDCLSGADWKELEGIFKSYAAARNAAKT